MPYSSFGETAIIAEHVFPRLALVRNCQELQSEANALVLLAPRMIFAEDSATGEGGACNST